MTGVGPGAIGGLGVPLTPYQVGLCCFLVQYAQSGSDLVGKAAKLEKRLFEFLFHEIQAARGPRQKTLRELRDQLCVDVESSELWQVFIARLRNIDSPDALFDAFLQLEGAISHEIASTSPLHASGIFGQFARCAMLAFKDASFEASVRLYDAVVEYVAAFEECCEHEGVHEENIAMIKDQGSGAGDCSQSSCHLALGTSQVEQLAQGLVRDLPASLGEVPFPVVDSALTSLREKLPLCHVVSFLRYVNCLHHRMADDAESCLRSFHDGHQQRGLGASLGLGLGTAGWPLGVPPEDGLPDLVQHASLALADLHTEMRHLDDALQAIGESIRAAQEASDGGCLCACLYMLSTVLLRACQTGKAFTMMRRCLHRAETLGLPLLQALCCLGIAHALSVQPNLSDRRKRGLLWKESISRMAAETQPATAALRTQGMGSTTWAGAGAGANAGGGAAAGARAFGFGFVGSAGGGGAVGAAGGGAAGSGGPPRGGLGVLAALLGHATRDEGARSSSFGGSMEDASAMEGAACRDALAHVTLASQLSTQAGVLGEARPKVLLCLAEVARLFGLQPLTAACCGLVLDVYKEDLVAEDRALALCQLGAVAAERSLACARPLLRDIVRQLPHAGHLWAHVVGPRLVQTLVGAGEGAAASVLLFQAVGVVRASPHGSAGHASQRLRIATNGVRLYHRQLLAAYRSAREAVENGTRAGVPGDICSHLLSLADVHLAAQDPIGALGPCLRCLSAAETSRLLHFRAEALVRLARVKLEMRDLTGALQLAEEVTPQLSTSGSSRLRGEALAVQADVLLALQAKHRADEATSTRLLREIVTVLQGAAAELEAVAELTPLRRCLYLLARVCHQLGDTKNRDVHAASFRKVSDLLEAGGMRGPWPDVIMGLARSGSYTTLGTPMEEDMSIPKGSPSPETGAASVPSTPPPRASASVVTAAARLGAGGGNARAGVDFDRLAPGEASPFSSAFQSAMQGSQADAPKQQDGAKCPALAQLLHLAEAEAIEPGDSGVCMGDGAAPGGLDSVRLPSSVFPDFTANNHQARDLGVPMPVGRVRALYPLAAVLGA